MSHTIRALFALTFVLALSEVTSLNILGIFPYQGKSHFFVFEPFMKELANKGHNVTVISYFPQKNPVKNYNDIALSGTVYEDVFPIQRSYFNMLIVLFFLAQTGSENCRTLLENEQVQKLWKTSVKFDVVVVEQFNTDCALGLAHVLKAPVVGITSHTIMSYHNERFGIPTNPSYVPFMLTDGGFHPNLYERFERIIMHNYCNVLYKYFSQRVDRNILLEYFGEMPDLEELGRDIKIMMIYHNPALTGSRLLPDNVKEVNGYHVPKSKPLTGDLKKFIDSSKTGVIYISFGSMLKATTLPKDKLEIILAALAELKYDVVWKWDGDSFPGNPKNIYFSNWLPQNDILAHPNVVAFYSHSGLLGTTEAIYHGVPVVSMPIFGDQPSNAAAVEESGLGIQIQFGDLNKEGLVEVFKKVLCPEFRENVKRLSKLWHDRPITPMESAIFWTEFAARNGNYTFRSAAADVPLYQYLYLDVIGITLAFLIVLTYIIKLLCCSRTKSVTAPSKRVKTKPKKA